jgi:hypothetical protein
VRLKLNVLREISRQEALEVLRENYENPEEILRILENPWWKELYSSLWTLPGKVSIEAYRGKPPTRIRTIRNCGREPPALAGSR